MTNLDYILSNVVVSEYKKNKTLYIIQAKYLTQTIYIIQWKNMDFEVAPTN